MKQQELEARGLDRSAAATAARRALGNLPLTRDHVRDIWIAPWLPGALQDYRLGLRMLLKHPGLTLAGGLTLAIAIGIGAAWYDLSGKLLAPTIPLPEGDRLVLIETQNALSLVPENGPREDVPLYAAYLGVTSAVMLAACLLACIGPARRALRINPVDALRKA